MSKIKATEENLGTVFSDNFAFSIPKYQRPYSWVRNQAAALFDDLKDASKKSGDDDAPYFLGSIVLIKAEDSRDGEVVDGQQRLTSLSLLFTALRNSFTGKSVATMQKRLLEEGDEIEGTKDQFRLQIRPRDNDFFSDNILKAENAEALQNLNLKTLPDPQKRLRENFLYFCKRIEDLDEQQRKALATYMVQHTYLVIVSTADLDSAFRIFSVLNDRGLPLTAADILKADIIGTIEDEQEQDSYNTRWEEAEEMLGSDSFSDLFSHIRMIHEGKKLQGTVLASLRKSLLPNVSSKKFIDNELTPYANAYHDIIKSGYESSQDAAEVNRYFNYLKRLAENDWQPAAIVYLSKHSNYPTKILAFLKKLERLAVMMWLNRYTINQRLDRYIAVLSEVKSGDELPASLELTDKEKADAIVILDGEIYTLSPPAKRKVILLRLDEALSTPEASYNSSMATIEHILPQTPPENSDWLKWWHDDELRSESLHRLGNLALINRKQNSTAKNYPFERKKTAYFFGRGNQSSPFLITNELNSLDTFTPVEFNNRQERFLEKLKQAWDL